VTQLRLHEDAAAEYLEAVRWYRVRSLEAARRFRAAVGAAIALVRENAEYSVIYMMHDAEVVVPVDANVPTGIER
jgi:hypothetical protein